MTEAYKLAPAWLQCDGKERFATPQLAHRVAKRRNGRLKKPERVLAPYRCNHCNGWHIGGVGKA